MLAGFGLATDLRREKAVTRAGTLDYMASEVRLSHSGDRGVVTPTPATLVSCRQIPTCSCKNQNPKSPQHSQHFPTATDSLWIPWLKVKA